MTLPPRFAPALARCLDAARAAHTQGQHHDSRRALFLDFLRAAFDVSAAPVDVERFVRIAS